MFQEGEMEKLANKMLEIPREKLSFFIYKIKYDWRGEKENTLEDIFKDLGISAPEVSSTYQKVTQDKRKDWLKNLVKKLQVLLMDEFIHHVGLMRNKTALNYATALEEFQCNTFLKEHRDSKRNYFWGPDIKKNVINLKCFYIIEKRYGYDVAASMMKDGTISELMHMIYWGIEFVVS